MMRDRTCPMNFNCSQMGLAGDGRCQNLITCIRWSDNLASHSIEHQLYRQDGRWFCSECGYSWRSQPQSICPRAPQYGPNRPYPGVVATRTQLQKIGLMPTRLPIGVAWNMAQKEFYDLYDLQAVKPLLKAKLRIYRICRLWKGKLTGVERTWKGMPEGEGWLAQFFTTDEAQKQLALLQSRHQPSEQTWQVQHIPGLPAQIYLLANAIALSISTSSIDRRANDFSSFRSDPSAPIEVCS